MAAAALELGEKAVKAAPSAWPCCQGRAGMQESLSEPGKLQLCCSLRPQTPNAEVPAHRGLH